MRVLPLLLLLILVILAATGPTVAGASEGLFAAIDTNNDGRLVAEEIPTAKRWLFDRLVRRADANGDGALDAAEFAEGVQPVVAPKPIAEPRRYGPPNADATRWLLLRLDTNRDRRLTADEAPKAMRQVFDELTEEIDGDKNGVVSLPELTRAGRNLARIARGAARREGVDVTAELRKMDAEQGADAKRFDAPAGPRDAADASAEQIVGFVLQQFDADSDARINRDEAEGRLADRFNRIDRNRDGVLDRRELTAAARFLKRRYGKTQ